MIFGAGDFNARIGSKNDYIVEIDNVTVMEVIDETTNKNGESFIDFSTDNKLAVLNGRLGFNDFTCIRPQGRSVVDYCFTSHEGLQYVNNFYVKRVNDILNDMSWKPDCSIPDHSLLTCDINPVEFYQVKTSHDKGEYNGTFPYSKEYYFDKIPLDFMNNDTINRKVTDIRMDVKQVCDAQSSVNNVYKGFGEILNSEMLRCLKKVNKSHKSHRTRCRFWDDKLNELYKLSNQAEKDFCNYKGHKEGRITLHKEFKAKRKKFDTAFRKAKRMYMRKIELEW